MVFNFHKQDKLDPFMFSKYFLSKGTISQKFDFVLFELGFLKESKCLLQESKNFEIWYDKESTQ
jgi:hypothetical protein